MFCGYVLTFRHNLNFPQTSLSCDSQKQTQQMDGILALGHFCETHGPCVILCTQRCDSEPKQLPHSRTVPWCEACQSIDVEQALVSKDEKTCYVTTRTPLQQDLAFLLKQATVRSLSCEVC